MTGMKLYRDRLDTPIGAILLLADDRHLRVLEFADEAHRIEDWVRRRLGQPTFVDADDPVGASSTLAAYFAGRLDAIDGLAARAGGTDFQERVWAGLRRIPCGRTMSYGAFAADLGVPTAQRAVGAANGRNPIAIVVPCHRLVGADGSLTGYGGGIERKRWLLAHEGAAGGAVPVNPRAGRSARA